MYERPEKYDFSGYVTRNDIRCVDGRTIRKDAFIHDDGSYVPLVWNHEHQTPFDVLGKVYLENRDDGVYGYGILNDTPAGVQARDLIMHGDIDRLSINAGRLKQMNGNVLHGKIREVSLVHSGANDGAFIDFVDLSHSDDPDYETEAFIYADCPIELFDADTKEDVKGKAKRHDELMHDDDPEEKDDDMSAEKEFNDAIESLSDEQKEAVVALLEGIENGEITPEDFEEETAEHSDEFDAIQAALADLTEPQARAVSALITVAFEDAEAQHSDDEEYDEDEDSEEYEDEEDYDEEVDEDDEYDEDEDLEDYDEEDPEEYDEDDFEHSDEYEGDYDMKYNAFENGEAYEKNTLSHADVRAIIDDAEAIGSLKKSFLMHADDDEETVDEVVEYGIDNIDYLFPDHKNVYDGAPDFIQRDMAWVAKFMNGTHKSPFARIKSIHANITAAEARAKGYLKGNRKEEEIFPLLKRTTNPQTVYKKQKFDRDDIIDVTNFDFLPWVKGEMQTMLREEIALASLIGDGRSTTADDHIKHDCIRPVVLDDSLYNTKVTLTRGLTDSATAKNIIDGIIRSRKNYKGSGNPTFFTTEDWLTEMLLLEDGIGHKLYRNEAELATALRCSGIETVQPMEGRLVDSKELVGVYLNPVDYTHGTDRGGETHFFDDFDIDFNQEKYLYETRLSGALTKPYSAVTILLPAAQSSGGSGNDSGSGAGGNDSGSGAGGNDSGSGAGGNG